MNRSKYLITIAVFTVAFVVMLGTGLGQMVYAVFMILGCFVGYTLWQAQMPTWWPFLFALSMFILLFIALYQWTIRRRASWSER